MVVDYSSLGLVNTEEMFRKALQGSYAIPGYNFNNMKQLQAIIMACVETEAPVILQVSKGARRYANQTMLTYLLAPFDTWRITGARVHGVALDLV